MSLRGRLILLAASAVAAAVCVAAAGSYVAVRAELRGQVDDTLEANAAAIQTIAESEGLPQPGRLPARVRNALPKALRERLLERGPEREGATGPPDPRGRGEVLAQRISDSGRPTGFPEPDLALPVDDGDRAIARTGDGRSLTDREVDGQHLRVLTVPIGGDGAIQLARSLDGIDDVLMRLRLVLVAIAIGGIGLAALLGWLVARRVIAPITHLSRAAQHVSETEDLSRRIDVTSEDEVGRLAGRFNAMLDTLQGSRAELAASVEAQRQLVADASHELRTPVASLRTDIETLIEHPYLPSEHRARILAEADRSAEELGELIADVIELARGEDAGGALEGVRLDEVVADAVARMGRMAPRHSFETDLDPCVVEARPDRLARAVNNLLDNACKYGPETAPIEVMVANGTLTVRDRGPGIPRAEIGHVFDRFYRGAGSRGQSGSGLGLAIVRQVAEAHGGAAEADNAPDGGAVFTLRLSGNGGGRAPARR